MEVREIRLDQVRISRESPALVGPGIQGLLDGVESPGRSFVETIWNVGYRFKAPA